VGEAGCRGPNILTSRILALHYKLLCFSQRDAQNVMLVQYEVSNSPQFILE